MYTCFFTCAIDRIRNQKLSEALSIAFLSRLRFMSPKANQSELFHLRIFCLLVRSLAKLCKVQTFNGLVIYSS